MLKIRSKTRPTSPAAAIRPQAHRENRTLYSPVGFHVARGGINWHVATTCYIQDPAVQDGDSLAPTPAEPSASTPSIATAAGRVTRPPLLRPRASLLWASSHRTLTPTLDAFADWVYAHRPAASTDAERPSEDAPIASGYLRLLADAFVRETKSLPPPSLHGQSLGMDIEILIDTLAAAYGQIHTSFTRLMDLYERAGESERAVAALEERHAALGVAIAAERAGTTEQIAAQLHEMRALEERLRVAGTTAEGLRSALDGVTARVAIAIAERTVAQEAATAAQVAQAAAEGREATLRAAHEQFMAGLEAARADLGPLVTAAAAALATARPGIHPNVVTAFDRLIQGVHATFGEAVAETAADTGETHGHTPMLTARGGSELRVAEAPPPPVAEPAVVEAPPEVEAPAPPEPTTPRRTDAPATRGPQPIQQLVDHLYGTKQPAGERAQRIEWLRVCYRARVDRAAPDEQDAVYAALWSELSNLREIWRSALIARHFHDQRLWEKLRLSMDTLLRECARRAPEVNGWPELPPELVVTIATNIYAEHIEGFSDEQVAAIGNEFPTVRMGYHRLALRRVTSLAHSRAITSAARPERYRTSLQAAVVTDGRVNDPVEVLAVAEFASTAQRRREQIDRRWPVWIPEVHQRAWAADMAKQALQLDWGESAPTAPERDAALAALRRIVAEERERFQAEWRPSTFEEANAVLDAAYVSTLSPDFVGTATARLLSARRAPPVTPDEARAAFVAMVCDIMKTGKRTPGRAETALQAQVEALQERRVQPSPPDAA